MAAGGSPKSSNERTREIGSSPAAAMSESDLIVVALASLVGSFVKSVTGMGFPLIAIPILTLFIGVEDAVVVIAIPNIFANFLLCFGVREERKHARDLRALIVAAILGAIAGTLVLVEAPEEPLLLGLAASVFIFVVQRWRSPEPTLTPATSRRWAPVAGVLAGFSHGAVGVSGPIVAMWVHGYRLSKNAYVFSVTSLFLVAGLAQLVVLVSTGQFRREHLIASSVALLATLCMLPVGTRMRSRIGGRLFDRLILGLLVLSGAALVMRALS
jgi:uncharacterized membrane protein YfcA